MIDAVDPVPSRTHKWVATIAYVAFLAAMLALYWYYEQRHARTMEKLARPGGSLDDVLP